MRGHHGGAADTGAAASHLPLGEQDGIGPAGRVQDAAHDRGREVEWQVPHQHMRLARELILQEVSGDDLNMLWQPLGQALGEASIDLDGR